VLDHSPDPDDVPDASPVESSPSGSEDDFKPRSDDEDSSFFTILKAAPKPGAEPGIQ